MKTVKFDLQDADGEGHLYEVELFSCDEAIDLQVMLAQPLLEAVGTIGRVFVGAVKAEGAGSLVDRINAIDEGDLYAAGGVLSLIPKMIEERGGAALVARIFTRTVRHDRVPAEPQPVVVEQHLVESTARDDAYADGNYLELWKAVLMVLFVNFSRLGRSGSLDWKTLFSRATGGLLKQSQQTTGTARPSGDSPSGNASPAS